MIGALRHYIKRFAELPLDLAWRKTGRLLRRTDGSRIVSLPNQGPRP